MPKQSPSRGATSSAPKQGLSSRVATSRATTDSSETEPPSLKCYVYLEGSPVLTTPVAVEYTFLVLFNGCAVLDCKWHDQLALETDGLPVNIEDPMHQQLVASQPLIFLLRVPGSKGAKDPDPLLNADNHAGATVDLFPLVLGAKHIHVTVPLVLVQTGEDMGCSVEVTVETEAVANFYKIPLLMTLISAHCLPVFKEGTVFMGAVGLDEILETPAVNFGKSLSSCSATQIVWATASQGGHAANTVFNVPHDDVFVPSDLDVQNTPECRSVYWNSMQRVLVDPSLLEGRLSSPFYIEVAGLPKNGKPELRGRYMGFIKANVLLEPTQYGVSTSTNLLFYNENNLPKHGPLLDLQPTSAKATSARSNTESVLKDEHGHPSYIVLRFDLMETLVPKTRMSCYYNTLGFSPGEGNSIPINFFPPESPAEDPSLDARKIRKSGAALAVHRELVAMSTKGAVRMGQSIKRTAASRLMTRVRMLIRQFPPGDISCIEWQDTVTSQHAMARRAVTASFEPLPPPPGPPLASAASRCRMAGDMRLANHHIETLVTATAGHPRSLLSKALACLEERNDSEARIYYLQALSKQVKNKYLLWLFGGQEFDKAESIETARAALQITVKGDSSDGISKAMSWAAVHTFYHYIDNEYPAFVAAKCMRKAFMLPREWKKFYQRWVQVTGEEEIFWIPTVISNSDPFLIAAAFFLCLRCFHFTERLLQCVEKGCTKRGAHDNFDGNVGADVCYIRAASLLIRRRYDAALLATKAGIRLFGPCANLSQMQSSCLACIHGWDGSCEASFLEAERAGAEQCAVLLLRAALGSFQSDLGAAMQRAARCHKIAPGGHSALLISRIYAKMGDRYRAERWAAVAVDIEPLLADGWAFLAILAMQETAIEKAAAMMRTAYQAGPISPDIKEEMNDLVKKLRIETLPNALVKDLCLCDYY